MFRPPNAFGAPRPPHPPPWQWHQQQPFQPPPPPQPAVAVASSFWQSNNVREHLRKLQDTVAISTALIKELEEITLARDSADASAPEPDSSAVQVSAGSGGASADRPCHFVELASELKITQDTHESLATDAANYLCSQLQHLLAPISAAVNQGGPWEETSAMVRLAQKLQKSKRNKRWRKRKRKHVAELFQKESADFERIDQEADEWRARQIANDIAKRKMESMKQIAKKKANEERKRLESELELALMVEKLQELRSIRVQKLKKQGHFLPEEDDKYLERVKAAVEEEERQAVTAARTDAAKNAILTAEESRKNTHHTSAQEDGPEQPESGSAPEQNQGDASINEKSDHVNKKTEHVGQKVEIKGPGQSDSVTNLPFEFYHYYHGSSYDMGTLIEVRRMWDSFIRPGGSRIPGHWIQPPTPADEVWASYLVQPK
ncbi:U11/U12 small nuclear ribonucleoprotein 59 kDa protein [Lolium perenne]|uniref:U11/U12 small nuclear ribonucleoprotein 59 kDa protein n=1 Tax=Lolium perenne TaxID=4522 RepID=UPI0021F5D090|nr:U11/U12 small nuclear ribonucleoprotein 59 kDa protein [Lolium perenne]XP_051223873.1 U11/U12 small nuclear ribonucleoprotein 59 kDa protein [Lolium perenne]XP_051223874.1 U11/U12 small nuclear ribonucleoprotein 59 kDa protein [Lolium perenne]